MRYRKTFQEAVKEVWAKAAKKKEEEKPVADEKPIEKPVEAQPVEDKDATIKSLKDQVTMLQMKLENEKNKVVKPVPNKDTGEVPLRTGIAQAILDNDGKSEKVIAKKNKKEKVSVGKGQSKIEIDPEVTLGIGSGGGDTGSGNLH
jgi:hypothetical protein